MVTIDSCVRLALWHFLFILSAPNKTLLYSKYVVVTRSVLLLLFEPCRQQFFHSYHFIAFLTQQLHPRENEVLFVYPKHTFVLISLQFSGIWKNSVIQNESRINED